MKNRAEGLEKRAATGDTQQLPPGTTIGMAIGAEIAPADPAAIGTVWVRAEMGGGVDLASSPPRGHDARGWGVAGLWAKVASVLTGVAVRLFGEALKRCEVAVALAPGWRQCEWCRTYSSPVTWPRIMEQEAQP